VSAVEVKEGADVMIGMGGEKVIDTAKIAVDRAGDPVIIVRTIASSDPPCYGCAVKYSADGIVERCSTRGRTLRLLSRTGTFSAT
jgi:glycerol dehydrogenase